MTTQRMAHGIAFTTCPICTGTIGTRGLASHIKGHGPAAVAATTPAVAVTPAPTGRPVVGLRVVASTNPGLTGEITAIDGGDITVTYDDGRTDRVTRMGFRYSYIAA